jgi:hypothetical protein
VVVRDAPLDPVNLAFDKQRQRDGAVLVRPSRARVYAFKPGTPAGELTMINRRRWRPSAHARVAVPVNFWQNGEFKDQLNPAPTSSPRWPRCLHATWRCRKREEYVSPDGSLVLPAYRVLRQGPPDHLGWRWADTLQTHGFVSAPAGRARGVHQRFRKPHLQRRASGRAAASPTSSSWPTAAAKARRSIQAGNVYVANGQIFIYGQDGKQNRPHRRAGTSAAADLRRQRQAHPVHSHAPQRCTRRRSAMRSRLLPALPCCA